MKFESTQDLIEYVNIIGEDRLKTFEVTFKPIAASDFVPVVEVGVEYNITEGAVSIQTLSDAPTVRTGFDETLEENVIHVDSYDSVPMSCSTGKVSFLGRTIYTNVCESDDNGPVIYLNIMLNETHYRNVPFRLKKTATDEHNYIMLLNPKTLTSNE